jgi:hypothetical protein
MPEHWHTFHPQVNSIKIFQSSERCLRNGFFYILAIDNCKKEQACLPFQVVILSSAGRAMCIACVALIAATMFFLVVVVFNPLKN